MFSSPSSITSMFSSNNNNNNNRMYSSVNNSSSNTTTGSSSQPQQQQQSTIHTSYRCDGCSKEPIIGIRYHCATCGNFDYCESCYQTKKGIAHPSFHTFVTHGFSASMNHNNNMNTSMNNSINNNMNMSNMNNMNNPPKPLNSSLIVNNTPTSRNNNSNLLTNNPMINSSMPTTTNTTSSNMSNSLFQPRPSYNPQQPVITNSYQVPPINNNNNIYQPPPPYQRSNPPPPTYPYSNSTGNAIPVPISQTPLSTSTTLNSAVKILPPTNNAVVPNIGSSSNTTSSSSDTQTKEIKECHCCSAPISANIHQCITCFDLTPSEDYCLCKDCHENFKQFGAENPIHLHDHSFQHFVDVKHLNIWKKTKGLENSKKQSSDKFGELEKLEIEEDHLLCVICNEKLRNIVFLDCKHCVCCNECVDNLPKKTDTKKMCPLCRSVSEHIKIFWA